MKRDAALLFAGMALAACTQPGPPSVDTTSSAITLTAFNGTGNPSFAHTETVPVDACVKFSKFPAQFLVSVGDEGGVRSAFIRLFTGRFVPGSVSIGPGAPESASAIAPDGAAAEILTIRLTPPAAGTVRTGLLALFEIEPAGSAPPISIRVGASDYRGNVTNLYQIDARTSESRVICRGDR